MFVDATDNVSAGARGLAGCSVDAATVSAGCFEIVLGAAAAFVGVVPAAGTGAAAVLVARAALLSAATGAGFALGKSSGVTTMTIASSTIINRLRLSMRDDCVG